MHYLFRDARDTRTSETLPHGFCLKHTFVKYPNRRLADPPSRAGLSTYETSKVEPALVHIVSVAAAECRQAMPRIDPGSREIQAARNHGHAGRSATIGV